MPRNGSGTALPLNPPVVPGTVITSTWANSTVNDIYSTLTQSLAYDGQTVPIADLPMGNFKHTNVNNAIQRNQYSAYGQVQDGQPQWMTVTGTDTILGTIAPGPTGYTTGQLFRFIPAGPNTTNAVTLNLNSLGAKNITKNGTVALAPGDLIGGKVYEVIYDGTQFQLLTVSATAAATEDSSVKRLVAANNSGTPNSQMDLAAQSVTLKGTATTPSVTRFSVGAITNNILTAGPAANGRDQAGAFAATSEVHFYFIWNGTALATISSLVAPPTGPTLPTGYTHWAYAMSVKLTGTNLPQVRAFGRRVSYVTVQSIGTPNGTTSFTYSTFVPTVAESFSWTGALNLTADGGGNAYASLGIDSGISNQRVIEVGLSGLGAGGVTGPFYARWTDMPNMPAQVFSVVIAVAAGGGQGTVQFVVDYTVPNY